MIENDIIYQIRELRSIKPREEWVFLTRQRIFDIKKERIFIMSFFQNLVQLKMVYALVLVGIFVSTFGFAQNSLPGDFLFSFKRITEDSRVVFVSQEAKSKNNLDLVNKRLDELTEITEKNKVSNLAPAINEVERSITKVAKDLKKTKPSVAVVSEIKNIERKTTDIKSLGVEIGEEEFDAVLIEKIRNEADRLEAEDLTEEEVNILKEVKQNIDEEKYAQAWESILTIEGIK